MLSMQIWKTAKKVRRKRVDAVLAAVCVMGMGVLFFMVPSVSYVSLIAAVKGQEKLSWDDFSRFSHTDIGSGRYVFEYSLAGGSCLYLSGSNLDLPPENIYMVRRDGVTSVLK